MSPSLIPVFDLDGTLLDSDRALLEPFVALGIREDQVRFGCTLDEECARLGVSVDEYVEAYDTTSAEPFSGVDELLRGLDRWSICSNKRGVCAERELSRLGWFPEVATFSDGSTAKSLQRVLRALGVGGSDVLFVGDSEHDRICAEEGGAIFAVAGWNPRARSVEGGTMLEKPSDVLDLL